MKKTIKTCFILLIISLLLTISKGNQSFFVITAIALSFISSFSYVVILSLFFINNHLFILMVINITILIILIKLKRKNWLFIFSILELLSIFLIPNGYLINLIYIGIFIPILILSLKSLDENCNIVDYNIIRITISSILISNLLLSDLRYQFIGILIILFYLSFYFKYYIPILISSIIAAIFIFINPYYSIFFVIFSSTLYIISLYQPNKISINNSEYIKYFEIVKKYINNTSSFSVLIDNKINDLHNTYCKSCSNYKLCLKNKLIYNNYLYTCIVNTSIVDKTIANNIKKIVLICPNHKKMLLGIKPKYNIDFNLNFLNSIMSNIKIVDNKLKNKILKRGFIIEELNIYKNLITFKYNENYLNNIKVIENVIKHKLVYKIKNDTVFLYNKPKYKLSIDGTSLSKDNTKLCGDSYKFIDLGYRQIITLSDGMGSGFEAFQQSSQMVNLVSDIAELNFNNYKTMALIKEAILYKDDKSLYATLDYLDINLNTKDAYLYKFASTSTYIIRHDHIDIYENENLPLGYDNLSSYYKIKLNKGDIIILFSDGMTEHVKREEIIRLLSNLNTYETHKIIYNLSSYANKEKLYLNDDITIIAVKIL
ncbi:MAG: SpoIIE family protein phosphatase [Anaeroplasmataceae bacterium]